MFQVVKKKRGSSEEADRKSQDTGSPRSQPSSPQRRFSTPLPSDVLACNDPAYETVSTINLVTQENSQQLHSGYETVRKSAPSDIDPNYEELQVEGMDPNYAHIRTNAENKKLKYSRLPQEQLLRSQDVGEPNYASISRGQKASKEHPIMRKEETDDPGYEQVRLQERGTAGDDSDQDNPGYERVHTRTLAMKKSTALDTDPGYEQVRLAGTSIDGFMADQDYEGVTMSQSDPNYETVHNEEPNYESVQYCVNSIGGDGSSANFGHRDEASNPLLGNIRTKPGI